MKPDRPIQPEPAFRGDLRSAEKVGTVKSDRMPIKFCLFTGKKLSDKLKINQAITIWYKTQIKTINFTLN